MFAIDLSFPYEHQINKIYPSVLQKFLYKVELLSNENGGCRILKKDALIYLFDNDKIASFFFASRFLFLLLGLLEQISSKIHEYKIIVETVPNECKDSEIVEFLLQIKNEILNYNQLVIGPKASKYLKKYLILEKIKNSSFSVCNDFSFFKNIIKNTFAEFKDDEPRIFIRAGQSHLVALYNFFLMHPLFDDDVSLFQESKKTYIETRSVLTFFVKNRFKEDFPKYFIDAFIIYAKLHIKMYKTIHKVKEIEIFVDDENEKLAGEVEKLKQVVGEYKLVHFRKINFSLDEIPDDMLELIYLLLRCVKVVFFDEMPTFFFYITNSNAYDEVLAIMFRHGIIAKKHGIYSYNTEAFKAIEKKLKTKKAKLDGYIANFLLDKYAHASLEADISLKNILDLLKAKYNEKFLIDVFFNTRKSFSIFYCANALEKDFANISLLKKYENAYNLQNKGNFNVALSIVKELNSSFHNYAPSGEYKNLSLLALLYLKNNNIGDSITYYTYSLEIAKKMRNDYFICEALFFLSVVYFLQKDFQNAFLVLQEMGKSISLSFRQEWKVFYLFMQGRVYLELGQANIAGSFFKLARDFSHLYFVEFETFCTAWYARACIYEGKIESGKALLNENISSESLLFLQEACIIYPSYFGLEEVLNLKKRYDDETKHKGNALTGFSFIEDVAWMKMYKMNHTDRMFSQFYSYYVVAFSKTESKDEREAHLEKLIQLALESLYAKDASSSLYLYLCYEAQLKFDGKSDGVALSFLSKACRVMQQASMLMYETNMRDRFIKQNIWNSKLFKVASENKLI